MTRVAVGIMQRADGTIFVQRRQGTWEGYWEFPGGKIEDHEDAKTAMARELHEETGVKVKTADLWLRRRHYFPQGPIDIHFFRVRLWHNEPTGAEGQEYQWAPLTTPLKRLLPANQTIWKWLQLPPLYAITAAEVLGVDKALEKLETALKQDLGAVQLRDKTLPPKERLRFAKAAAALTKHHGALLLINDNARLATAVAADGLHLSSAHLRRRKTKPKFRWTAASCHNAEELAIAKRLKLDFAVLSPVSKTLSHVAAAALGWEKFSTIAAAGTLPIYALGGMTAADLDTAYANGASGIAMMRAAWE